VTLSTRSRATVTAHYSTEDGTATTADGDYSPISGVVTFAPDDRFEELAVLTGDDTRDEPDEIFTMTLSDPSNTTIGIGSAQGTVNDNDIPKVAESSQDTTTTSMFALSAAPDDGESTALPPGALLGGGFALLLGAVAGLLIFFKRQRPAPSPPNTPGRQKG